MSIAFPYTDQIRGAGEASGDRELPLYPVLTYLLHLSERHVVFAAGLGTFSLHVGLIAEDQ